MAIDSLLTTDYIMAKLKHDLQASSELRKSWAVKHFQTIKEYLSHVSDSPGRPLRENPSTPIVVALRHLEPLELGDITSTDGWGTITIQEQIDLFTELTCHEQLPAEAIWRAALKLQACKAGQLNAKQVENLSEQIDHPKWQVRKHVVLAIGKHLGTKSSVMIRNVDKIGDSIAERMSVHVEEESAQVREACVRVALAFLPATKLLKHTARIAEGCLKDPDVDVRELLSKLLAKLDTADDVSSRARLRPPMDRAASEAILKGMLSAQNRMARQLAVSTLRVVQPTADEKMMLAQIIKGDDDLDLRVMAAKALGGQDDSMVDSVMEMIGDKRPQVRVKAILMVGDMGGSQDVFLHKLASLLANDPKEEVRVAVAAAFSNFGPKGEVYAETFADALFHPDERVRKQVYKTLQDWGHQASLTLTSAVCAAEPMSVERIRRMHALSIVEHLKVDVTCAFLCEWSAAKATQPGLPLPVFHLRVLWEGGTTTEFPYTILQGRQSNAYVVFSNGRRGEPIASSSFFGQTFFGARPVSHVFDWTQLYEGGSETHFFPDQNIQTNKALWLEVSRSISCLKRDIAYFEEKGDFKDKCLYLLCGFGQGGIGAQAAAIMLTTGKIELPSGLAESFEPDAKEISVVTFGTPNFISTSSDPDKMRKYNTMVKNLTRGRRAGKTMAWLFEEDPVPAMLSPRFFELYNFATLESGMLYDSNILHSIKTFLPGQDVWYKCESFESPLPTEVLPATYTSADLSTARDVVERAISRGAAGNVGMFVEDLHQTHYYTEALMKHVASNKMANVVSVLETMFTQDGAHLLADIFSAWAGGFTARKEKKAQREARRLSVLSARNADERESSISGTV